MDLLLFENEDEAPDCLFNSEDSSKSFDKKVYGDEMGENDVGNGPFSAENRPFHLQKNVRGKLQRNIEGGHNKTLIEALKIRMPALRVWAPKQKGTKSKKDRLSKIPKRKDRTRACYDTVYETPMTRNTRSMTRNTVCETPMTSNTRSSPQSIGSDDHSYMGDGNQVCGSVAKALFRV